MNFKLKSLLLPGWIFVLCITFGASTRSYAQLNSGNLIQYTEKDGLPGPQVSSVLIDRLGYVWTATINGLARYDGYEFKRFYYNPNDTLSIHGLVGWSLFEDRRGNIWVGTQPSYLNVYDPATRTFRKYDFSSLIEHPANIELDIRAMCEDNNGRMYFGLDTYYGDIISSALLYKDENDDKLKRFPIPDSLKIENVYRIIKDSFGNIWIISNSGIYEIDTKGKLSRFTLLNEEFKRNKDFPGDLQFDRESNLWIITQGLRLYEIDHGAGAIKTFHPDTLSSTKEFDFIAKKILIDKDDNIWIGTNVGVQLFNKKTGKFSRFNNGIKKELEHMPVMDMSIDSFGTLWIGSFTDGLIKYEDKPQLKSYAFNKDDKNSLTAGWANLITESSDGKIWITTGGSNIYSGLDILDSRTGVLQAIPYTSFTNRISGVSAIWENAPGEMYLGMSLGLYSFSESTHRLKRIIWDGLPDSVFITEYYRDSRENEWICTFRGLYKKDKGTPSFKKYDLSQIKGSNASSNEITHVYESKKHGLWILTNNGLFLYNYNTGNIERHGYDKKPGDIFVTQDINSFYEDPRGIAWVGTWQGGLSKYNVESKKIKTYTREQGLPSMSVQAILADEKNNSLWLSTFEGLSRFNLKTETFTNFSQSDGIQSQLFADGSFLKTSTGLFVFGGSNGIVIFNPDEVNKNSTPPKVFLTDLKLFNRSIMPGEKSILKKPIYETSQITLEYNQNNISIEFLALHYSNPAKNNYSYKLENYDNEWRDVGNLHSAFYSNLPPGEYTFHVKAANDKGVWNEQGATLKIIVLPPWWKTTWAYIFYGLIIIALAFAVDRYFRHRLIQKERERNRARELEQAKEIEKAYYKLEETHEALKSTQNQLIQSEKMASLGELTAGIAHEIQNPLNFVNNFSEVNTELIDELKQDLHSGKTNEALSVADDIKENNKKIVDHGKRADAIVKGMLQHSRTSSGQKEPTDINALTDEYLRLSYHGFRAKDKSFNAMLETDFDKKLSSEDQKIKIIPQDIGRVLLNLFTNAFYAVSDKQKPQGEQNFHNGSVYEPKVAVSTKKIDDKVEIRIADNGNGIPRNLMDKIFQPFFTTKPAGKGTGLGLSLSYDIIKAHGGELKVETKPGEGTDFIIVLHK